MSAAVATLLAMNAAAASPPLVDVCWGYGCKETAQVALPDAAWQDIRAIFAPAAMTPAGERNRIARAVAQFERTIGPLTGTDGNLGRNLAGSGKPGQMDCIDESRNTSGYLQLLAEHDLLAWHVPAERERRAPLIFNQHWTATVVDRRTGQTWVVDSWFHDNGSRPFIVPLDEWRRGASP